MLRVRLGAVGSSGELYVNVSEVRSACRRHIASIGDTESISEASINSGVQLSFVIYNCVTASGVRLFQYNMDNLIIVRDLRLVTG